MKKEIVKDSTVSKMETVQNEREIDCNLERQKMKKDKYDNIISRDKEDFYG